jgi:hypothetical protein
MFPIAWNDSGRPWVGILIGMVAIPPLGGYSGGDIQSLKGWGALTYRSSPFTLLMTGTPDAGGFRTFTIMGWCPLKNWRPIITATKSPIKPKRNSLVKHHTPSGHFRGIPT